MDLHFIDESCSEILLSRIGSTRQGNVLASCRPVRLVESGFEAFGAPGTSAVPAVIRQPGEPALCPLLSVQP